MIDLNDIALFVQVVKAGSFAEAARRVGMPANTASRRIQQLEQQLGVRLLHRSTRKLALTDAGEALYARSVDQIDALSEATVELAEGSETPIGKVRVAAPVDFFNWFPLEWVQGFLQAHPRIRLEFVLSDARADLVAGGIDVAIRAGTVTGPTLIARRVGCDRALLVASPAYLAARGAPTALADLAAHDCITIPSSSGRTVWRMTGPDGPAEVEVRPRFSANSALAQIKACVAGIGIALLTGVMARQYLRDGQLVQLLPDHRIDGLELFVVYQSRRQLPRAVSAFIDFASTRLAQAQLVDE
ncbi:LysR family transcriptional regulator [Achromobacter xylosoxidans]|uniref:LysR family transcriptional regulator n=1 Tax=Alcaligenes xylosoxydans xylosoxydans TaxID=85698 RepID=UPI001F12C48F